MTLRYEGKKPAGLDWSTCNDGDPRPEVWKTLPPKPKAEPKEPAELSAPGRQRLSPAVERQVIRLYRDEKMSALRVAVALGIRSATVFKVLKRNGVPSRSRSEGIQLARSRGQA